jgi:hypothetical protein
MSFVTPQAALYELAAGVVLADGRIIVAKHDDEEELFSPIVAAAETLAS